MTGRGAARSIALPVLLAAGALALGLAGAPAASAATWSAETSPTTNALYGVTCPNASNCWAVGGTTSSGKIIHTSNGAATSPTWSSQTPPSGANAQYNDVDCVNTSDCWAVGNTSKRSSADRGDDQRRLDLEGADPAERGQLSRSRASRA